MIPDIDKVTALIREVAEAEILPRFNNLAEADRWEKRPGSWVTVADTAAEARLVEELKGLAPNARVVGEEGVEADPAALDILADDGPIWIIDPLDGTSNFASGKPRFAVMVAYVEDGETIAGWIHHPLDNLTAVAVSGEGAFMNDERISAAPAVSHEKMTISLGARVRRQGGIADRFSDVTNTSCCGVDYLALSTGKVHAAHYRRLQAWDHAPGELIFREAGGFAACLRRGRLSARRRAGWWLATGPERIELAQAAACDPGGAESYSLGAIALRAVSNDAARG